MKSNRRKISLILIIIGSILIISGTIMYFIDNNSNNTKKPSDSGKDNIIQKTPEEITLSWLGAYENEYNKMFVIVNNFDKYDVMMLYAGNDFFIKVKNISYEELTIDDNVYSGTITKENNQIKLSIKNKKVDFSIDEVFTKVEDNKDTWTGMYSNEKANLFITKIDDGYTAFSFVYNDKNKEFTYSQIINLFGNNNENKISENLLQYSSETEGKFVIEKKDNNTLNVQYTGKNSNNSLLNGIYKKNK